MMTNDQTIEAWIDVGGTFTDCYVRRADGTLLRDKTLSSGRVPISWYHPTHVASIIAPELRSDLDGFWVGADVLVIDSEGCEVVRRTIRGFQEGCLTLSADLPDSALSHNNAESRFRLELDAGIAAPVLGVRRLLQRPLKASLPPLRVRLGTTKGTNALLTRRGARTALAITSPFEDLLTIGDQTRPMLFDLAVRKPTPLAEWTVGIEERLAADGSVLRELNSQQALSQLRRARAAGCTSLAICLMHSHVNPRHEQLLKELAGQAGFEDISCSCELAPLIEIVARAQTTVVDAYLSPIVRGYLAELVRQFSGVSDIQAQPTQVQLHVMTSAGGLVDWREYSGKDSILSGPAGGVSALKAMRGATGIDQLIGLDMGGTSTDVSRVTGEHDLQYESTKAGVRILTPTLPIETVASGGGSICRFDGVSLRVGPESAGASPGPACYGRNGPLTVTDLNVFLGRIPEDQFPFELDRRAIETRLDALRQETLPVFGEMSRLEIANGLRRIANEQMAEAVRTVSIAQGADPREHALVGFGGAAGQHLCEIAESLGISKILDSAEGGLFSALGMGLADSRLDAALPVYRAIDICDWNHLAVLAETKAAELTENLRLQGARIDRIASRLWLELRYAKSDATLTVAWQSEQHLEQAFHGVHRQRYGYDRVGQAIELVAIRVECISQAAHHLPQSAATATVARPCVGPQWPSIMRNDLRPGDAMAGPLIVCNAGSTLVVEAGWEIQCRSDGTLLGIRQPPVPSQEIASDGTNPLSQREYLAFDPIFRDCFAARLQAIATQMGLVLQQTAVSVNVKQRRDYSCAVFDSLGVLLANAPHVPVHLGAMGQTVRAIMAEFPDIHRGDSFITNDPYRGGSHLPDVTVIAPIFSMDSKQPVMFVANRAHHADVGGITPGSMSVTASKLGEEGVVIPPMKLTAAGENRSAELRALLERSAYPPRNIHENLADILAQQAANMRGAQLLEQFAQTESWPKLLSYCTHLLSAAQLRVEQFIGEQCHNIARAFQDHLDDGTAICVAITPAGEGRIRISFEGSGPVSNTNFNANPSIVTAAVMYVLRCLIADDLPLNEGVMRCVELIIPTGVLNPPPASEAARSPAVAAGNVETSQRIVDVLLGAFSAAAASQGTMNNLLFGNPSFGFYETICGGAGATPNASGESGVHTHMTNTRLTDPEILESRYPVRLTRFALRRGSGGAGIHRGGEGVIREIEFLEPVSLSLLSSRRGQYAPFGLAGGEPGRIGENRLLTGDGQEIPLEGCCQLDVHRGQRVQIKTPGGGGYGDCSHNATVPGKNHQ